MANQVNDFVVPTDPAQLKQLKQYTREACDSMTRIAAEKDLIKTIVDDIHTEFEIPKAAARRLIKHSYAADIEKKVAEVEDIQVLVEAVNKA